MPNSLKCKIKHLRHNGTLTERECDRILKALEQQPKIGHWINLEKTKYKGRVLPFWGRYECSKCGGHGEGTFYYCPNCGARMIESEDKE